MTFGSLFSGAGGFDIGMERAGMTPAFQCEIDPQASAVLAKHWPEVPRHGDIRTLRQKDVGSVDVLAGGFPCQDLSVAGKREGLKGERSGLFYELLRVARLCRPRFVVWENVPGLLSSDHGRDFGRVLRGLADIGYFGAWRVLDARFFGVPQRRRRVFGVFARGRFGAVRCGEILALTEGVCRDSAAGQESGKDVAGHTGSGTSFRCVHVEQRGRNGQTVEEPTTSGIAASLKNQRNGFIAVAARCLTSSGYRSDGETDNFVCVTGETTHALTAIGADASEDGTGGGTPVVFSNCGNDTGDSTETLRAASHGALPPSATPHAVRRLTPRECERLMSWPDDWTRYDDAGNEFADGPRYRMCGNGVVSNCAEWIAKRIKKHEE